MRIPFDTSISFGLGNKASCFLGNLHFLKQTAFLEFVTLRAVSQTEKREALYNIIYMGNLKRNDTDELITKRETDSQT